MKTDELKFKKFEEECRRYLYEKEALLQLEKRFVKVNTSNTHYNDNCSRYDPLKKYRFLEAHTNHVNHVFKLMEKEYGSLVANTIKEQMTHFHTNEEIDEAYKNSVICILNKTEKCAHEKENLSLSSVSFIIFYCIYNACFFNV